MAAISDDVFWKLLIPDKIERLRMVLRAIRQWVDIADEQFEKRWQLDAMLTSRIIRDDYNPKTEDMIALCDTQRTMYASLAVAITASIEEFEVVLCRNLKLPHQDKKGRSSMELVRKSLDTRCKISLEKLHGFASWDRTRILNNCFKHSGGTANDEFVKKFGIQESDTIAYEKEDWNKIIDDTDAFLTDLASHLKV